MRDPLIAEHEAADRARRIEMDGLIGRESELIEVGDRARAVGDAAGLPIAGGRPELVRSGSDPIRALRSQAVGITGPWPAPEATRRATNSQAGELDNRIGAVLHGELKDAGGTWLDQVSGRVVVLESKKPARVGERSARAPEIHVERVDRNNRGAGNERRHFERAIMAARITGPRAVRWTSVI